MPLLSCVFFMAETIIYGFAGERFTFSCGFRVILVKDRGGGAKKEADDEEKDFYGGNHAGGSGRSGGAGFFGAGG
jgi:hypothetical protein